MLRPTGIGQGAVSFSAFLQGHRSGQVINPGSLTGDPAFTAGTLISLASENIGRQRLDL
jgi:hypothetical protein